MNVIPFVNQLIRSFRLGLIAVLLITATQIWAQDTATDNGTTANDVIPNKPNPPRLVNDFVGILSSSERSQLEQKLRAYNDSTSTQITIVIVKTTEPYPIGDFAFRVGRKWGVGQQGKNNGLILAWATQTRKIYIAPGYGLEGAIPDAIAKRIISNTIAPAFKQEQWYKGLDDATTEIIQRAKGEYEAEPKSSNDDGGGAFFIVLIIFIIIIFIISRRNRGGGSSGNRGGGWGGPIFFPTSGWGSSGGGSSWGGGSSGGSDFGGFGGGSFGGGGAGGDY